MAKVKVLEESLMSDVFPKDQETNDPFEVNDMATQLHTLHQHQTQSIFSLGQLKLIGLLKCRSSVPHASSVLTVKITIYPRSISFASSLLHRQSM